MRGVEVRAAAAAVHQVPVVTRVVRVVVQVAGEHQLDLRPGWLDDGPREVVDRIVRAGVLLGLDPARGRRAHDHLVARA